MIYSLICEKCNKPFESKRAHATTCSPKCRVALAREAYKKQAAEDGDPSVVYEALVQEPQIVGVVQPEGGTGDLPPEPTITVSMSSKPRVKLPLSETPLRADVNSLARQVIQNMKQRRPLTELENLEKNQLSK